MTTTLHDEIAKATAFAAGAAPLMSLSPTRREHWYEAADAILSIICERVEKLRGDKGRYLSSYEEGRDDALNDVLKLLESQKRL